MWNHITSLLVQFLPNIFLIDKLEKKSARE